MKTYRGAHLLEGMADVKFHYPSGTLTVGDQIIESIADEITDKLLNAAKTGLISIEVTLATKEQIAETEAGADRMREKLGWKDWSYDKT